MDKINQRLKQVRTILNFTQSEFSKQIFTSKSSMGEMETGVRKINDRVIHLISTQFNVNKNWLKNGEGEMFNNEKPDTRIEHLIELYKQLDKPLQKYLIEQTKLLVKMKNENAIMKEE